MSYGLSEGAVEEGFSPGAKKTAVEKGRPLPSKLEDQKMLAFLHPVDKYFSSTCHCPVPSWGCSSEWDRSSPAFVGPAAHKGDQAGRSKRDHWRLTGSGVR